MLRALAAGKRDLGGGQQTQAVAAGEAKWGYPFFCMDECDKKMCLSFSLGVKSLLLMLLCDSLGLYLFVGGRQGRIFTGC